MRVDKAYPSQLHISYVKLARYHLNTSFALSVITSTAVVEKELKLTGGRKKNDCASVYFVFLSD